MYTYSFLLFFFFLLPWQSKHKEETSATCPILLDEPKFEVHPFPLHASSLPFFSCCFSFLHVYLHLNTCLFFLVDLEPFSVGMGMSMEGFFNGADDIAKAIASALTAATQGVPAEALVPPSEPITVGKYLGQEGC